MRQVLSPATCSRPPLAQHPLPRRVLVLALSHARARTQVGRLLALECAVWEGLFDEDQVPVSGVLGPEGPHLLAVAPLDTDGEAIRALELDTVFGS
jgi:hypothetical protein